MTNAINTVQHKFSIFTKMLCILVIVGLLDAQTTIMQAWAWVTMLNDRIPEQGIEQALDTTFSGQYPCDQCLAIAQLREKQKHAPVLPEIKDIPENTIGLIPHKNHKAKLITRERTRFEVIHYNTLYGVYLKAPGPPPQWV